MSREQQANQEPVARYYLPEKNPQGATLPGIPLHDITVERWDKLTDWQQRSVDASGHYSEKNPNPASRAKQSAAPQQAPAQRSPAKPKAKATASSGGSKARAQAPEAVVVVEEAAPVESQAESVPEEGAKE